MPYKTKICGIYCIENIVNNKKYIGQAKNIKKRWSDHKYFLRKGKHTNDHLQSSWNKHKEENFKFTILQETKEENLTLMENYWIIYYNTINPIFGYNDKMGESGSEMSLAARKKLSDFHKGKPLSEETRAKISRNTPRKFGKENSMFGRTVSEEERKVISQNQMGKGIISKEKVVLIKNMLSEGYSVKYIQLYAKVGMVSVYKVKNGWYDDKYNFSGDKD